MKCGHTYFADEYESCPECESREWDKRKSDIGKQLLRVIAESPRDLIVQGKRYRVTMKSYERGGRVDQDGVCGYVSVEGDEEHFEYELTMAGWGILSSHDPHEEEEGD